MLALPVLLALLLLFRWYDRRRMAKRAAFPCVNSLSVGIWRRVLTPTTSTTSSSRSYLASPVGTRTLSTGAGTVASRSFPVRPGPALRIAPATGTGLTRGRWASTAPFSRLWLHRRVNGVAGR